MKHVARNVMVAVATAVGVALTAGCEGDGDRYGSGYGYSTPGVSGYSNQGGYGSTSGGTSCCTDSSVDPFNDSDGNGRWNPSPLDPYQS